MSTTLSFLQQVAQSVQDTVHAAATNGPGAVRPAGPPRGFSTREAFFELVQFVGWFLSIGALGFRYGIVRRVREMSEESRTILRPDNAAMLGIFGVVLLLVSYLGGPWIGSMVEHKTFIASLPRNRHAFELRIALLLLALIGFAMVRAARSTGWAIAAVCMLIAVLQPLYTGRGAGKVNAVHILAASTWLGTLLVLLIVGIRGVIRSPAGGTARAELVSDLVNSFSPLALSAATVVGLTGLTTAWMHLHRLSSLWTTSYGMTLIVKLILVATVVVLGAWNWRRVRPSLGGEGTEEIIRRSATMELTFGALVLIVTAVLVSLPSPR